MKAWDVVQESGCIQQSCEGNCSNMSEYKLNRVRSLNVSIAKKTFKDCFLRNI